PRTARRERTRRGRTLRARFGTWRLLRKRFGPDVPDVRPAAECTATSGTRPGFLPGAAVGRAPPAMMAARLPCTVSIAARSAPAVHPTGTGTVRGSRGADRTRAQDAARRDRGQGAGAAARRCQLARSARRRVPGRDPRRRAAPGRLPVPLRADDQLRVPDRRG